MSIETPKLERPEQQRTQVVAKDMLTGKSKSKTIYDTTPEIVIKILETAITDSHPAPSGSTGDTRAGRNVTSAA